MPFAEERLRQHSQDFLPIGQENFADGQSGRFVEQHRDQAVRGHGPDFYLDGSAAAADPRAEPAASVAPSAAADPHDERDALQRATHWRSRGECHAALLAWLIADAGGEAP